MICYYIFKEKVFYEGIMGEKEAEMIEKVIIAYESIINVENKVGLLVPYEDFEKSALENFKEYKKRISKKEINELFWKLMSAGVVFIPKKGFIQRIISKRRFDENI